MDSKKIKKAADSIFRTLTIDIESRDFNKKNNTFSFEMSDKDLNVVPIYINLRNPKTNNVIKFKQFRKDMDASGEDVYGYWYKSLDGKYKLLIIND